MAALRIRFIGLDPLDDVGARGRNRNQHQVGAADRKDRRLRGRAGGVDHDDVVGFVEFADERHDPGFVEFVAHGNVQAMRGSRGPVGQRVVEIGVDRGNFQARNDARPRMRRASVVLPAPPFVVAIVIILTMNPASYVTWFL